jgi:hypothetical protein
VAHSGGVGQVKQKTVTEQTINLSLGFTPTAYCSYLGVLLYLASGRPQYKGSKHYYSSLGSLISLNSHQILAEFDKEDPAIYTNLQAHRFRKKVKTKCVQSNNCIVHMTQTSNTKKCGSYLHKEFGLFPAKLGAHMVGWGNRAHTVENSQLLSP